MFMAEYMLPQLRNTIHAITRITIQLPSTHITITVLAPIITSRNTAVGHPEASINILRHRTMNTTSNVCDLARSVKKNVQKCRNS
jgi:hypothetical protein